MLRRRRLWSFFGSRPPTLLVYRPTRWSLLSLIGYLCRSSMFHNPDDRDILYNLMWSSGPGPPTQNYSFSFYFFCEQNWQSVFSSAGQTIFGIWYTHHKLFLFICLWTFPNNIYFIMFGKWQSVFSWATKVGSWQTDLVANCQMCLYLPSFIINSTASFLIWKWLFATNIAKVVHTCLVSRLRLFRANSQRTNKEKSLLFVCLFVCLFYCLSVS